MKNYLVIVMDSARWDTFEKARTPNINSIGAAVKAHSPTASTIYSIFSYLYNYGVVKAGVKTINGYKCPNEEVQKIVSNLDFWVWIPVELRKKGYYTALLTGNPLIYCTLKDVFSIGFDVFEGIKYNEVHCADQITDDIIDFITKKEPYFVFALIMDTHFPYWNGKEAYGEKTEWFKLDLTKLKEFQIKAIEAIDKEIGKMLPFLRNCEVTITSDHGDVMGEIGDVYGEQTRYFGHGILQISPELFRVPFVKGTIK